MGNALSPGGATGCAGDARGAGSAGGEGDLWAPSPTTEFPPVACSQPGAGDVGQGRESLGTQDDKVIFTGFVKMCCGPHSLGFAQAKRLQQWGFKSEGNVAPQELHKASSPTPLCFAELHKSPAVWFIALLRSLQCILLQSGLFFFFLLFRLHI